MKGWREQESKAFGAEGAGTLRRRALPEETAIALTCNGSTHAVMMGTPTDLIDFATGFLVTEGLATPGEIKSIEPVETAHGIDVQIWLADDAASRLARRRRSMAGPVGCGLCGIESLEAAMAEPPSVAGVKGPPFTTGDIAQAMALLPTFQPLHDTTRAVHGAAFYAPGGGILLAREDVGRHNALDKLIGAMIATGIDASSGAMLITSRVSIDMVQKVLRAACPILIAVSAPTASALDLGQRNGLTIVALARGSSFEIFAHAERISASPVKDEGPAHAAR